MIFILNQEYGNIINGVTLKFSKKSVSKCIFNKTVLHSSAGVVFYEKTVLFLFTNTVSFVCFNIKKENQFKEDEKTNIRNFNSH